MRSRAAIAVLLALLPVAPARAIIVYESPGRLTTMPVLPGGVKPGWQFIGTDAGTGFAGIPIGRRAWVTATHVTGTGSTGFWYANTGTNYIQYFGTRAAVSGDLAVMVLNAGQPDFEQWAPVWSGTGNLFVGQPVYMYGFGVPRGSAITNNVPAPNTPKGWGWGAFNYVMSYGTNQLDGLAVDDDGNRYVAMDFAEPNEQNGLPGTEGILAYYDSGGGVFSFNAANNRWELLGVNSFVETVSTTSGGQPFGAALYDARGFYDGTTLITGTAQVPLSSYATALPYKYDVIAPYVGVPEPPASLLAAAAAGLLAAGNAVRRGTPPRRRSPGR